MVDVTNVDMREYVVYSMPDRVRRERLSRGWSVRTASVAGGISNTYWANFEAGTQPLTAGLIAAIATAFGWSPDWPSEWTTPPTDDELVELRNRVAELEQNVVMLMEWQAKSVQRRRRPPRRRAEDN